jgi:hypothetical protein
MKNKRFKKTKTSISLTNESLINCFSDGASGLVFWSFRYFLGRMTITTGSFAEQLAKAWPLLDERIQNLIRKELDEAFARDDKMRADPLISSNYYPLGMDYDREHWEKVRAAYAANDSHEPGAN